MKKTLHLFFTTAASAFLFANATAQTTLFSETFEGAGAGITLNTNDNACTSSGYNSWVINNAYTGGSVTINCSGFPLTAPIANTPNQPAGVTANPNSNYMHILSLDAASGGVTNANYLPANGLCGNDENYFAKTMAINTTNYNNVTLSFWWICGGSANEGYGELYFSTDGGITWVLEPTTSQYVGQASWVQASITNPAFNNKADLRFGFQFVNMIAIGGTEPSFSLDDIKVAGTLSVGIANSNLNSSLSIYPNPVNTELMLNANLFSSSKITISIINELGQVVLKEQRTASNHLTINTENLTSGVYSIIVSNSDKQVINKFVKM
jgi:hypothetical protein